MNNIGKTGSVPFDSNARLPRGPQKAKQTEGSPDEAKSIDEIRIEQTQRKETAKENLRTVIRDSSHLRAYQSINSENFYKLFIDGNRWPDRTAGQTTAAAASSSAASAASPATTFTNLADPDLIFDRREPGYMAAMMEAFIWLQGSNQPLSADFIRELHDRAVHDVGTVRESEVDLFRTGYRHRQDKSKESFGVVRGETITDSGFQELLLRRRDPKYLMIRADENEVDHIFEVSMEDPQKTIKLDPPPAELSLQWQNSNVPIPTPSQDDLATESVRVAKRYLRESQENIQPGTVLKSLKDSSKNPEAKERLERRLTDAISRYKDHYNAYKDPRIILRVPPSDAYLPKAVDHFINLYKIADKSNEDNKLKAIARLVQDLDQLHPFYDGNIRTFGVLLMNKLLLDEGLSPCCLIDPNCLDGLSERELVEKIKEGQRQFQTLQNPPPIKLD